MMNPLDLKARRVPQDEADSDGIPMTPAQIRRTAPSEIFELAALRLDALDGLRGVAALVVVAHHALLLVPELAQQFGGAGSTPGQPWWLSQTPLHLLWAGSEAVAVFFVLSGFVLALPFVSGRRRVLSVRTWLGYYPQRLTRLYLPVVVAALLTAWLVLLFPRDGQPHLSWWYSLHDTEVDVESVTRLALLMPGSTWLNSAFWSLRWEVLFSVLLPLYLAVLTASRRWPWPSAAGVCALVGVGSATYGLVGDALQYLGTFAAGVLLAQHRAAVSTWAAARGRVFWGVTALSAVAAFQPTWLWPHVGLTHLATTVGAVLVVLLFIGCGTAQRVGSSSAALWLGRISFSLYLVHEPIMMSIASSVSTGSLALDVTVILCAGLAASLCIAVVFMKWCEMPAHRLSRVLGRACSALVDRERSCSRLHDVLDLRESETGSARPAYAPPAFVKVRAARQ